MRCNSAANLRLEMILAAVTAFVLSSLLACGSDATGAVDRRPAALAVVSGAGQVGPAGTTLAQPLVVRVTDSASVALGGVTVEWAVISGAGQLDRTTTVTASDGTADVEWTLGPAAGTQTVRALVSTLSPVAFSATAQVVTVVASVDVTPNSVTFTSLGDTARLSATALSASGTPVSGERFQWTSLNPHNVTVDSMGKITAKAAGTALITAVALCCGEADTTGVNVTPTVASVLITPSAPTVSVGNTVQLNAQPKDANGNNVSGVSVTWTSSNTNIATVTPQGGLVTGVNQGSTTIRAAAGGKNGTATLTVQPAGGAPINLTSPSIALTDMVGGSQEYTYHGHAGGLYNGTNTPPQSHLNAAVAAAASVQPLSSSGSPSSSGRIGLVAIGMSNARLEYCDGFAIDASQCAVGSWLRRWRDSPDTEQALLKPVVGARFGYTIEDWDSPNDPQWDWVETNALTPAGLTPAQVQIVVIKNVYTFPSSSLPAANANAYAERNGLAAVIAAAKVRYPNIRQVFLIARTYGGWSNGLSGQSPEPYAFEHGFAVKWLVQQHIDGAIPATPWVGWGAYLWANGDSPRNDGLTWPRSHYGNDAIHPNLSGIGQAGRLMHEFFSTSPFSPWYRK